jgi:hypothetical protein
MPANPNFDDIVTTTLRLREGKTADNATKTMALLDRLRRKGKVQPGGGGRTIVQELEVALNPWGGWYAGFDLLSTNAFEPFSAAEYDWKQAYVPAVWNGREKLINQGKWATINLIEGRLKNSEKSLYDLVAQGVYSDGTSFGGKQISGLGLYVVTGNTTGTIGGIDRALNTFWRNQIVSVSVSAVTPNLAANNPSAFLAAMNSLAIACTRGTDRPDLWIGDGLTYALYLNSLQPIQRITNPELGGYGFTNLKYYGVGGDSDVVLDNGYAPAKTMFALNTDYIYLRPHEDRNFVPIGGDRVPVNQDATLRYIGVMLNLCLANAALQGLMKET